jgi:hypothetical protein
MGVAMNIRTANEEHHEKAINLTEDKTERQLSRIREKLVHRLENKKLSVIEEVAIHLELDDEQLNEWRAKMFAIRATN